MKFDPETLHEKLEKADEVLTLMRATEAKATTILGRNSESDFSSYEHLGSYGWSIQEVKEKVGKMIDADEEFDGPELCKELGISLKSASLDPDSDSSLKFVRLEHDKPFTVDGVEYPPTIIDYQNYFDPAAGFLGAFFNWANKDPKKQWPALHHWSDVAFILWTNLSQKATKQVRAPEHIVRMGITNTETKLVIDHIRESLQKPKNLSWPGLDFDIDSPEGRLLVQTVNGKGAAWFLINHKEAFGAKCFDRVRLWHTGQELGHSIVFYVSDVPEHELVK